MMNELSDIVLNLERKKAERDLLQEKLVDINLRKAEVLDAFLTATKARALVQKVSKDTLDQLSVSVGDIVSQALSAVFENPYTFVVDFVNRRNKTECDLLFERNNNKICPMDAAGGGVIDVTSFALRATFWMLSNDLRPILILDEPFKFVSSNLQDYCAEMLKVIADQLGFQIIMVTHLDKIIESVDRNIELKQDKGISHVI